MAPYVWYVHQLILKYVYTYLLYLLVVVCLQLDVRTYCAKSNLLMM